MATKKRVRNLDEHTLRWCVRVALDEKRYYRATARKFKPGTAGREANEARGDGVSLLAYRLTCAARAVAEKRKAQVVSERKVKRGK